jgi:hypothetical protein
MNLGGEETGYRNNNGGHGSVKEVIHAPIMNLQHGGRKLTRQNFLVDGRRSGVSLSLGGGRWVLSDGTDNRWLLASAGHSLALAGLSSFAMLSGHHIMMMNL